MPRTEIEWIYTYCAVGVGVAFLMAWIIGGIIRGLYNDPADPPEWEAKRNQIAADAEMAEMQEQLRQESLRDYQDWLAGG
jgi:hypothetical protein